MRFVVTYERISILPTKETKKREHPVQKQHWVRGRSVVPPAASARPRPHGRGGTPTGRSVSPSARADGGRAGRPPISSARPSPAPPGRRTRRRTGRRRCRRRRRRARPPRGRRTVRRTARRRRRRRRRAGGPPASASVVPPPPTTATATRRGCRSSRGRTASSCPTRRRRGDDCGDDGVLRPSPRWIQKLRARGNTDEHRTRATLAARSAISGGGWGRRGRTKKTAAGGVIMVRC